MKTIAFYLPQFYEFKENNEWWGEGFTEWTNVKKAKPLYKGHYQPTVPLNENYYSLNDIKTMEWQIKIARDYGLYGFCFYHYWFGEEKKLMELPVENYLHHSELDFPFCLSWANHNWTRTWVGGDKDLLMEQKYGDEGEWKKHFEYLLPYFKDSRYIQIDYKPVLVIYLPQDVPCLTEMKNCFDRWAQENGFNGITWISQALFCDGSNEKMARTYCLMDYVIRYEPNCSRFLFDSYFEKFGSKCFIAPTHTLDIARVKVLKKIQKLTKNKFPKYILYSYDAAWKCILNRRVTSQKDIAGAFVNCDVTPRRQERAVIYKGATPQKFESYMTQLHQKVKKEFNQQYCFLSAWNEWGEGMYLEPDEKNGFGYLEGLKSALLKWQDNREDI